MQFQIAILWYQLVYYGENCRQKQPAPTNPLSSTINTHLHHYFHEFNPHLPFVCGEKTNLPGIPLHHCLLVDPAGNGLELQNPATQVFTQIFKLLITCHRWLASYTQFIAKFTQIFSFQSPVIDSPQLGQKLPWSLIKQSPVWDSSSTFPLHGQDEANLVTRNPPNQPTMIIDENQPCNQCVKKLVMSLHHLVQALSSLDLPL